MTNLKYVNFKLVILAYTFTSANEENKCPYGGEGRGLVRMNSLELFKFIRDFRGSSWNK